MYTPKYVNKNKRILMNVKQRVYAFWYGFIIFKDVRSVC